MADEKEILEYIEKLHRKHQEQEEQKMEEDQGYNTRPAFYGPIGKQIQAGQEGLRQLLENAEKQQYMIAEKIDQLEHVVVSVVGRFPTEMLERGPDRDRESLRDHAAVLVENNNKTLQRLADMLMALHDGI